MDENERAILRALRRDWPQGVVMRELTHFHPLHSKGRCAVVDVAHSDPKMPSYSKILFQGATWADVRAQMGL